ncbi:hypothetical protein Geu3261_0025_009 [Komagataeibacter europaeus NBRC 3261]|uniref:Uncharacterized protein n=1 Tax=Komagataeibacter europaeus NBRC 3261 TaxID=1234669 RepID=A0A0D6PWP1_KOMEU|nr:hypothetical protein Geu3261_0025_009 [Komagataeibacter europaeus NBRC 3261]
MSYGPVPSARTVMEPAPARRAPTPEQRERQLREEAVALTTLLADIVGCAAPNLPEALRAELIAKLETASKGTEGLVSVAAATALRAIDKAI